jgi:NAD(P)-dependent dehydrogenase (short-subunit alcohol dehydrogenase family)
MDSLTGKVAVVTGAASGMGRAFAERFARAGMKVVLADIERPVLDEAVAAITATGAEAIGVVTDVGDPASVDALRDQAIEAFGRVNVLCNNAGVGGGSGGGPDKISLADWEWVLKVNLWGVIHGHHSFLGHLMEHGDGHIVNTASMAGHLPGHSAYNASKFAVVGITEGLYNTLKMMGSGVGVSCLCPGFVSTNIMTSYRNRPEWAAPTMAAAEASLPPQVQARMDAVADRIRGGKPPAEVADLVHDAVLSGQFWIYTDEEFLPHMTARYANVTAARNPTGWMASA